MPLVDYEQISLRLRNLKPGGLVVYFTGFLDSERLERPRGTATATADLALEVCRQGRALLVQRRLGPPMFRGVVDWRNGAGRGFEYIAVGADDHDAE